MKVKGFLKDVGGASRVTKMRKELIAKGSPLPDPKVAVPGGWGGDGARGRGNCHNSSS